VKRTFETFGYLEHHTARGPLEGSARCLHAAHAIATVHAAGACRRKGRV
jgi:hypothetical protein